MAYLVRPRPEYPALSEKTGIDVDQLQGQSAHTRRRYGLPYNSRVRTLGRVSVVGHGNEVDRLLRSAGLPVSDLSKAQGLRLFGVRIDRRLVGVVGVELHGTAGLLRSLAVDERQRTKGYGRDLVARAERWALQQGVKTLYLLTTDAAGFFGRLGYQAMPRSEAPAAIAGTAQFAGLCPSSAHCMRKPLA